MMKNLSISISKYFFFNLTFLTKSRQNISLNIGLFLTIIDFEIILRKLLGLENLVITSVFYIYKSLKIIIVSKDKDIIFPTF